MTKKILIVDDSSTNRAYLMELLRRQGFETLGAGDGEEGFTQVLGHKPDLVICDVLMPNIDGYEFVRRLRENPAISGTPVMFYTGQFMEPKAHELARAAGVLHILEKPCPAEVLLAKVDQALKESSPSKTNAIAEQYHARHLELVLNKLVERTGELDTSNRKLAILIELNLQLVSHRDPLKLLDTVCEGTRTLTGADHALLAIRGQADGQTHCACSSEIREKLGRVKIDRGLLGNVFRNGTVARISGEDAAKASLPEGYPACKHLIAIPMTSPEQTYGWLCLSSNESGFDDEDELLLTIIADQTARVYESDIMYNQMHIHASMLEKEIDLRKRTQLHLSTQFETAQLLANTTSFAKDLPKLLKIIGKNFKFAAGRLWSAKPGAQTFHCLDAWLADADSVEEFREQSRKIVLELNEGVLNQIKKFHKPIWFEDYSKDPNYLSYPDDLAASFERYGLHCLVTIPIQLRGELIGLLTLMSKQVLPRNKEMLEVLDAISNQIGQSIERKGQQDSITRLNRLYAVLSGINNTIVHEHDREKLLRKACDIAVDLGRFQLVWIGLFDRNSAEPSLICANGQGELQHYADDIGKSLAHSSQKSLLKQLLDGGQAVIVNRLQLQSGKEGQIPLAAAAVAQDCESGAIFPLSIQGQTVGLMALYAAETDFFDDQEISLLGELASDISFSIQYIQNEEKLNYLAYNDPVTGLINRTALQTHLRQAIANNRKQNSPFGLLLANINNFRDINDTLGYANADLLLKKVTARLLETVFERDIVAGLGGDNFAILLPRLADKQHIDLVIDKIALILQQNFTISDIPVNVEVTLGIALFPDDGEDSDTLWRHADVALRKARKLHRTHLRYTREIDHYDSLTLSLIGELRRAIDQNELILHFQPKIDFKSNRTTGVEALIRWQHPQHGLIFPDKFIPSAEQTELINPLTGWVLKNSLMQVKNWHQEGLNLNLSVNLSPRNLQNPELMDEILNLVKSSAFPLEKLLLEITESMVMADPVHAMRVMEELQKAGIQFSLDDFGIGQSSLTYLKDLPITKMKIDKSFTIDIRNPSNAAIVRSAIDLGHNLGLSVIAEGVEDEYAIEVLRQYACDLGQGYYFSKPLPAEQLSAWFGKSPWGITQGVRARME